MSRIFDTFTIDVQIDILETCIAYAKADECGIGRAIDYGRMFLLTEDDFKLIEIESVQAWYGEKPNI